MQTFYSAKLNSVAFNLNFWNTSVTIILFCFVFVRKMLYFISVKYKNCQIYNLRTLSASDLISSKWVCWVRLIKVKEDSVNIFYKISSVWFECVKMLTHISMTSNFLKRTLAHVLCTAGPILSTTGILEYLGLLLHFSHFKNKIDYAWMI